MRRLVPFLLWAALLASVVSVLPARASWMVPGLPIRPKDFTLVKKDGWYHLFYIRHDMNVSDDSTEVDFGHAISRDLWYWTQLPPVVPVRDSSWDHSHVWAPSIVERDGVYYMLYTGVSTLPSGRRYWQSLGLATSTDLMEWSRLDAPVYACTDVPWTVCDSSVSIQAFRDPFVMPDPAHPGQWLLYYVTFPAADSTGMVVGVAGSGGDFTQWSDLGSLWITNRQYSFSPLVESPHLFAHAGLWYLFITTDAGQPLTFWTSPDPVGPVASWTSRGRLGQMLGQDTQYWYASEYFRDGLVDYFAYVIGDRITIMKMAWGSDWRFSLTQPDWLHVVSLSWDPPHVAFGDSTRLAIVAANWTGATVSLEGLRVLGDGTQVPVSLDSLGLPASVPLTGDTTRVAWRAWWQEDSLGTTDQLRLVVRTPDQTAIAPTLLVDPPPPLHVTSLAWDSTSVQRGDTTRLAIAAEGWQTHRVSLEAVRARGDGGEVALPLDSLGLPATVVLTGDTTRVAWAARWQPDSPDSADTLRLRLRLADHSVTAPLLGVAVPPLHVTSLAWDSTGVRDGHTTMLAIVAGQWVDRQARLQAWRVRADSSLVALPPDSLGLPASVALTADTTRLSWVSRWLPDSPDTSLVLALRVGVIGAEVVAPTLTVLAPLARVTALAWDSTLVHQGDSTRLAIVAQHWANQSVGLGAWRVRLNGTEVPIPLDSLGLPASVVLTADTTRLTWQAKWVEDPPDTSRALRLRVRVADGSATAPLLTVIGPPYYPLQDPGPPPPSDEPVKLWHRGLHLLALARPVGGELAMLIESDHPLRGRLDIYDAQGRRVRNLTDRVIPQGATVVLWDGRRSDGSTTLPGIYFGRLTTAEGARTVRLLRLR